MTQEQIILVTGAASGIGLAIAKGCVANGATVLMADRQPDALGEQVNALGAAAVAIPLDITDEAGVRAALAPFSGKLTGAVNCAGIGLDCGLIDTEVASFRAVLEVNLTGSFIVCREAVRAMHPGGGSIVNITSVSGVLGNMHRAAYGASKGGLEILTKIMASELGRKNIRVNSVAPGPIETPMTREHHTQEARRGWSRSVPMERYGTPEEIACAVLFLLDASQSGYVNGLTLCVDGGFASAGITPAMSQ